MSGLPAHAEVVVIGGGIIGCSTAYHLARDHKADVVLIEQGRLTGGSTWHAAGLVGQLRSSASITQVLRYSVDLYKRLEAETGLATGWRETGCLRLACNGNASAGRLEEILQPFRPGEKAVTIRYVNDRIGGDVDLPDAWRVNLDDALLERLRDWLAPENVQVLY